MSIATPLSCDKGRRVAPSGRALYRLVVMPSRPATVAAQSSFRLVRASDLKRQRGWSEGLVTSLLGAPDALSPNPHGWRAPMRWFRVDRVEDAERSAPFAARVAALPTGAVWRRELPTRSWTADEIEGLEWLDDPARIALFHTPRRARTRLRRRPATSGAGAGGPGPESGRSVLYPLPRFEVLTLF
jgi:hypothetical protein